MRETEGRVYPVILAGGFGTRLWPLSREAKPKHLLNLVGELSLLQQTVQRAREVCGRVPCIITNEQHRFLVGAQVQEAIGEKCPIILETIARNTAAAAAVAALWVQAHDPEGIVLLLPSDHYVGDAAGFGAAVASAALGAMKGMVVTFGIAPTGPETGYGYIRLGSEMPQAGGCRAVASFIEKPARDKAQAMLDAGGHVWNAGMFTFKPGVMLAELARYAPQVHAAAQASFEKAQRDLDFLRLDRDALADAPSISIDYAVMERTDRAAVCPMQAPWGDLGSWQAIWESSGRDDRGNVIQGDVLTCDAERVLVRSDGMLTAVVGVSDLVVVVTGDAVLVSHKDRTQDVKQIVEQLKAQDRRELREHAVTQRPWGQYERIDEGAGYQVKQIMLHPGASISLQLHHKRAEHWVVVQGVARVTKGEDVFLLRENESTYIPPLTRHRLENPGDVPLRIIEVQSGSYLGEDDIVRFEDVYGRVT